jgi:hypothetical protein
MQFYEAKTEKMNHKKGISFGRMWQTTTPLYMYSSPLAELLTAMIVCVNEASAAIDTARTHTHGCSLQPHIFPLLEPPHQRHLGQKNRLRVSKRSCWGSKRQPKGQLAKLAQFMLLLLLLLQIATGRWLGLASRATIKRQRVLRQARQEGRRRSKTRPEGRKSV